MARLQWAVGAALGVGLAGAGLLAVDTLPVAADRLQAANVILVLGGDGLPRAAKAAALYRAGLAPRVLVSGAGECEGLRDVLVAGGVPAGAVLLECASRSTHENAAFSAPLLRGLHARTVLVVTSWFHLRRALACLADAAPEIRWLAVPALPAPGWPPRLATLPAMAGLVAEECVKLLWYWLRYHLPLSPLF